MAPSCDPASLFGRARQIGQVQCSSLSDRSYLHPDIYRSPWSMLCQGRTVSDMVDFPGAERVTAATGSSVVPPSFSKPSYLTYTGRSKRGEAMALTESRARELWQLPLEEVSSSRLAWLYSAGFEQMRASAAAGVVVHYYHSGRACSNMTMASTIPDASFCDWPQTTGSGGCIPWPTFPHLARRHKPRVG